MEGTSRSVTIVQPDMHTTRILGLLALAALVCAACASTGGGDTSSAPTSTPRPTTGDEGFVPGDIVAVDLPRAEPDATEADLADVAAADASLGLDLLRTVAGDENTMLSPYSIATALSMLHPGARGVTAEEIAEVLHVDAGAGVDHAARNDLDRSLTTTDVPIEEEEGDDDDEDARVPFTIRPANAAWGQGGYPFRDEYLQILAEHYGAGMRLVDYAADPEGSRTIINEWVQEATEDRVRDLVPEGAITSDSRLTLANAIWFKANWAEAFDPAATAPGPFVLLDGTETQTPLMHANLRTGYVEADGFAAVRLPYAGDAAMVIALPDDGTPADLAATLTADDLDIDWDERMVDITLPSFEFESEIDLRSALQGLGMRAAFEAPVGDGADFTGITAERELFVSGAFHKTFIALDEQGTEAAAATAIVIGVTSAPLPATFSADRPFLFWIEHEPTGELLFLGQVTNPA